MIIIVIIKIVFDWIYEGACEANPQVMYSVNWSIAYNFIDYVFLSAVLLHMFYVIDSNYKFPKLVKRCQGLLRHTFLTCSIGYWVVACWELGFINESREIYLAGLEINGLYIGQIIGLMCGLFVYWLIFYFKQTNIKYKWI